MKNFVSSYFKGSFREMVSFFAKSDNLTVAEIDRLMKEVKQDLENPEQKEDE